MRCKIEKKCGVWVLMRRFKCNYSLTKSNLHGRTLTMTFITFQSCVFDQTFFGVVLTWNCLPKPEARIPERVSATSSSMASASDEGEEESSSLLRHNIDW